MIRDEVLNGKPLDNYDIIDAHAHIGPLTSFYNPETEPGDIVGLMDRIGIKMICASGMDCLNNDVAGGNDRLYKAMEEYPDRILGYCTVNPWNPYEMEAELEKCLQKPGVIGIKIHPSDHSYSVTGENYEPVWKFARENNLIILSHTWADGPFCPPGDFEAVLEKYPEIKLLLGHSGGLYYGYEQSYRLAGKYPGVYLEICGCEQSSTWLASVLEHVPFDRVIFGTDQVFHDPRYLLGRVALADIAEEAKYAILGGNMRRLLADMEPTA